MPWSRRKPFAAGNYWFRETSREQPVSVEVFYQKGVLYALPPSHGLPVPLSEVGGEWSDDAIISPPETVDDRPGNFLRHYPLMNGFTLIFTDAGRMFVRYVKQAAAPHQSAEMDDIEPKDFSRLAIDDVPLSEIVAEKLEEILPQE